ncbi:MAG: hypothetical protein Q8N36_01700, partial [bacterium]|nr:hypothetical protein [bacterium]
HLKTKLTSLLNDKHINTMVIMTNTEEFVIFHELTIAPQNGRKMIGKGEAAALALAKVNCGIIASNNLKDISQYALQYNLLHVTTGKILIEALNNNLIDENMGNRIWSTMLQKKRILPAPTFSDYLRQ